MTYPYQNVNGLSDQASMAVSTLPGSLGMYLGRFFARVACGVAAACALGALSAAHAQTPPASLEQMRAMGIDEAHAAHAPEPMRALLGSGMIKQARVFEVENGSGLLGWILQDKNEPLSPRVFYTQPGLDAMIVGQMLGIGQNNQIVSLSDGQIEKFGPEVDLMPYWSQLEKSAAVVDGELSPEKIKGNTIYAFFDANCIFCHYSWLALKPYMDAGLQVRWVMVGMLAPSSEAKAAALLQTQDPRQAMQQGHQRWESMGAKEAFLEANVDEATRDQIKRNNALMTSMGLTGTPAFVYKDAQGKISVHSGMTPLAKLPEITGMGHIENANPKLDRFR